MLQSAFGFGLVAQLVEQRTENPRVGGSTPSQATNHINNLRALHATSYSQRSGVVLAERYGSAKCSIAAAGPL